MNDILDIEIILKRQKYGFIYNIGVILIFIIVMFLLIANVYKYKTYYVNKGIMVDGYIKVMVNINDIKYISLNDVLEIDSVKYNYLLSKIDEELYVDDSYNNYKYLYLKVDSINNLDNYVYELKFVKENKKIIEYLENYL